MIMEITGSGGDSVLFARYTGGGGGDSVLVNKKEWGEFCPGGGDFVLETCSRILRDYLATKINDINTTLQSH